VHSVTLVLLRLPVDDLHAAATALLRPHRLNEDAPDASWHLDYWTTGGDNIADPETAAALGVADDEDLAPNVCFVSRLAGRVIPGALVTPDGAWHDLQDFGWRLAPVETPANKAAWERWAARVEELLAAHAGCVAVEFDTHS